MRKLITYINQKNDKIHSIFCSLSPFASIMKHIKYLLFKNGNLYNDVIYTITNTKDFSP